MSASTVMALVLENRLGCAPLVQQLLTSKGCVIRARVGLHESCEDKGLILLHLSGSPEQICELETELGQISGVKVNSMKIEF